MLFCLLKSKKGFTIVELIIVVTVLSILTAVAVPLFSSAYTIKMVEDCDNQCIVIQSQVEEVMAGMIDNGRMQSRINFAKVSSAHKTKYPGDGVTGNADDEYEGKECFELVYDDPEDPDGDKAFTIGDIRGGYFDEDAWNSQTDAFKRENGNYDEYNMEKYDLGCTVGYYLKKQRLEDVKFYTGLFNEEIPICPFAEDDPNKYHYYILWDEPPEGSEENAKGQVVVLCSCPECNDIED